MPVGEKHNLAHRDRIGASAEDRKNAVPVNERGTRLHDHSDPSVGRMHLLRSCVCEFIGTFFLCVSVGLANVSEGPIPIGIMLGVYVYSFGHISGANFNPAVSLALYMRGKLNFSPMIAYIITQMIAGFVAGGVGDAIINDGILKSSGGTQSFYAPVPQSDEKGWSVLMECIYTFMLVSCVLHTATTKAQAGNHYYGAAIGMSVISGASLIGGYSGAALNPAVGIALPVVHDVATHCWVYIIGPVRNVR